MPTVFWPYRPRDGYPSPPRWLYLIVLILVIAAFVVLMQLFPNHPPGWNDQVMAAQGD